MILCALHGITKGFPTGDVLLGVDWEIKSGEKIALLGRNGSGKSTLLGALSGRIPPDGGTRTLGRGVRVIEMAQIPDRGTDIPLFDYLALARGDLRELRRRVDDLGHEVARSPHDADLQEQLGHAQTELENSGGYRLEHDVEVVLTGLGFAPAQWRQPVVQFSGGERTRIELGRLLLTPADLWLMDEPTNHLDIAAVEWLEGFLADSPAACVLVSHDRALLERFAGRVVELVAGRLETYDGNYQHYRNERALRQERRQKAYDMQRAEIKRIEDFIARNIAGQKSRQAQSRRKSLSKLDRLAAPHTENRTVRLEFEATRSPFREVLVVRDVTKSFGDRTLFDGLSFVCERSDKIGVIGPNGAGKSTLLRAIVGLDNSYDGEIRIGERVEIGYFDQHLDILSGHGTVVEEIWDEYPHFEAGQLRSYLARFLFTGEDVFKPVNALSGGEKSRLALAKLMLTRSNFLVLDEPTNHLDIATREVLEEALAEFEGTALVVSHDRKFLDRFTTKILWVADGHASASLGNYSDWAARRAGAARASAAEQPSAVASEAASDWQQRKARRTETQRLQRKRNKLEEDIAALERQVQDIEGQLADESVARDWKRLAELTQERTKLYEDLDVQYAALEALPEVPEEN